MDHWRCGIGLKATRPRQNFSVTNPGSAAVISSSLMSEILCLIHRKAVLIYCNRFKCCNYTK